MGIEKVISTLPAGMGIIEENFLNEALVHIETLPTPAVTLTLFPYQDSDMYEIHHDGE